MKRHGPAVVEDAAALDAQSRRRYVERCPPVPLTLRQVDPLTLYRDLIDRTTGDPQ